MRLPPLGAVIYWPVAGQRRSQCWSSLHVHRHCLHGPVHGHGAVPAGGGAGSCPGRGGEHERVQLDDSIPDEVTLLSAQAIELDSALTRLEQVDARAAQLVELHFFAGQSFDRIAELLETSRRTVFRDWEFARAFLLRELRDDTSAR